MGDFFSNLLSRHTQSENVVQPRGTSIFEGQRPVIHSFFSPSEGEFANPNTSPSPSDAHTIPDSNQFSPNGPLRGEPNKKDHISSVEESKTKSVAFDAKHVNKTENPTQNYTEDKERILTRSIVQKMKLTTHNPPQKNDVTDQQKQFKIKTGDKSMLDKRLENPSGSRSNNRILTPDLRDLDKRPVPSVYMDQLLVRPNKEIDQQLLYTSYNNGRHKNSSNGNDGDNGDSPGNQTPTVKIHIGRIDIKAVGSPVVKTPRTPKSPKKSMSLQQFLEKREGK